MRRNTCWWPGLALGIVVVSGAPASTQETSSSAVKAFAAAAGAEMRYVAAKVPDTADEFVGALHIPGVQLVLIWSRYEQPALLSAMLGKGDHQGVYTDLYSASYAIAQSRVVYEDMREDGLARKRDGDAPADTYTTAGKVVRFDGDWKKQQLSEQDYQTAFSEAEEKYAKALVLLTAELKKSN